MLADNDRRAQLREELATLTTEAVVPDRGDLETLPTAELVRQMNTEDALVPRVVAGAVESIADAVDRIVERMQRGGRLIYVGAGTAGRIGILDASECPPTFGTDPSLVVGVIAGGTQAITTAVENSEDDLDAAAGELAALGIRAADSVVGISASGRTPYVVGALRYARGRGALTISVASNPSSPIAELADVPIDVVVGPEFIAGSTRLKAGTAQKLVVNMLSTLTMVRLGKTYRGVMVDLQATNEKLKARSERAVIWATGATPDEARAALDAADGSVKLAILLHAAGTDRRTGEAAIAAAGGRLSVALARLRRSGDRDRDRDRDRYRD